MVPGIHDAVTKDNQQGCAGMSLSQITMVGDNWVGRAEYTRQAEDRQHFGILPPKPARRPGVPYLFCRRRLQNS